MTNDPKLMLMGQILDIIGDANLYANQIDKLMTEHPGAEYHIPAENLARIASSLRLTAVLATNLFEENQNINDQVVELLKNHGITPPNHL